VRDVTEFIVSFVVTALALFAFLDWEESRLSRRALEDAWPPATRTLAVVYFSILGLPVHLWRTRARRHVEPRVLRLAARMGLGGMGRLPNLLLEMMVWVLATGPVAAGVMIAFDTLLEAGIEALPESCLEGVLGASVVGFVVALLVRHKRGGFIHRRRRAE
jgi:hypothetical protein